MSKQTKSAKQLYRSTNERVLAGVAGGIAEFLEIDSTLVRIVFALLSIFGGSGIIIYLVLWLLIPTKIDQDKSTQEIIKKNAAELKQEAKKVAADFKGMVEEEQLKDKHNKKRKNHGFALFMVILGIGIILSNYGFLHFRDILPVVLILLGLMVIFK